MAKPNNKNCGQSQKNYVAVCFTGKGCSMPHIRPPLTMIVPAKRSFSMSMKIQEDNGKL
jgi:hypothetical protein